jgi:hypothetical protein
MAKRKTVAQLKKELARLKTKAPRSGVMPTKVVKSKKVYSRKKKHKSKETR